MREDIPSTQGKLTIHVVPGCAPNLNPDELVRSHVKRTGVARKPLRAGEKLELRIERNCMTCRRIVGLFDHSSARLLSPIFRTAE